MAHREIPHDILTLCSAWLSPGKTRAVSPQELSLSAAPQCWSPSAAEEGSPGRACRRGGSTLLVGRKEEPRGKRRHAAGEACIFQWGALRSRWCSLRLGGKRGGLCQPQAHVQLAGPTCDQPMSDESQGGQSPAACVTFGEQPFVFDINIHRYSSSPGTVVATELPGFDNSCERFLHPERTELISYSHNKCIVCMHVCWEGRTVSKWVRQWSSSHWTWLLVPQLSKACSMASSKSLHLLMAQFSCCETEIKVLTLGKVHTVTSISRWYGRLYQYYYYGMHKENNRQNWNKTKQSGGGKGYFIAVTASRKNS